MTIPSFSDSSTIACRCTPHLFTVRSEERANFHRRDTYCLCKQQMYDMRWDLECAQRCPVFRLVSIECNSVTAHPASCLTPPDWSHLSIASWAHTMCSNFLLIYQGLRIHIASCRIQSWSGSFFCPAVGPWVVARPSSGWTPWAQRCAQLGSSSSDFDCP